MIRRLLLALIRFYRRFLSPMHAPCCPFTPTCSTYAMQAVERHGALYGGYLAIRRLLRCQPLYKGSFYDPVPPKRNRKSKTADKKVVYPPAGKPVHSGKKAEDNS